MKISELTQDQVKQTHAYLLTYFAQTGQPPSSGIIAQGIQLSPETAEAALRILEAQGSIYRDPSTREILAGYPFSTRPTKHVVRFPDGHSVFSMCAIDALGMPTMLGTDAIIESRCAQCGREIRVTVTQNTLADYAPRETRVWYMQADACCIPALDQCPSINFFCSSEHVAAWRSRHPKAAGEEYDLPHAFARGGEVFGNLLRSAGSNNG